jgi:hypothetical protein
MYDAYCMHYHVLCGVVDFWGIVRGGLCVLLWRLCVFVYVFACIVCVMYVV